MLEDFIEWLKQLAVFMILCETILSFAPTQTYKKYIKPFVGMILLFRITVFLFGAAHKTADAQKCVRRLAWRHFLSVVGANKPSPGETLCSPGLGLFIPL